MDSQENPINVEGIQRPSSAFSIRRQPGPHGRHTRRQTAPFQPRSPNAIPFMSFDVGSATAAAAAASSPLPSRQFGSISTIGGSISNFGDESPLLEELGINTRQIWRKTSSILNPLHINPKLYDDADRSGPFLFLMAFGLFQLSSGKIHFGIILGWATVSALFLYVVFNMLADRNGTLDLHRCVSLIGYCMLPMVILSFLSMFLPQAGLAIFMVVAILVIWSKRVCT